VDRLSSAASFIVRWAQRIADRAVPYPPADARDSYLREERYIVMLRWVGSLLTLPLLEHIALVNAEWAYATVLGVLIYSTIVARVLIPRGSSILLGGLLPFALDNLAVASLIYSAGGVHSQFYVLYFVIPVAHALRFPTIQSVILPLFSGACYAAAVLLAAYTAGEEFTGEDMGLLLFHIVWIPVNAIFAATMMARARTAESAHGVELRRTKALLQAAYAPAASLTLSGVLGAVVHHSRLLTEADCAAVLLYSHSGEPTMFREQLDDGDGVAAFGELVRSHSRACHFMLKSARPVTPTELAESAPSVPLALDQFRSFFAAPISGPRGKVGFVAVASRQVQLNPVHYEALAAFLERAALAVQNARLYEQLQSQMQELRTLHDHIVRAERLAVIGELAAKVAHELNNPLASIHLYNSLLLEEPAEPDEQRRLAENVQEQVERAKRVVRDILDYSRPAQAQLQVTSLNSAVEQGMRFVRHAANAARISVVEDYADNLPWVRVDLSRMAQVFTNLTMNAIQAMPRGGKLQVSTGLENNELFVRFTDTGTGIEPEARERIFDPFYTTKPAGQGTGLGLAVCRSLVNQHHGDITVDSEPGKGSTFTVWLPPAEVKEAVLA